MSDFEQSAPGERTAGALSEAGIVTKLSAGTVQETVDRTLVLLAERGLKLFTVFDHSGEARADGLALRDTQVIVFGSPVAGTPVMDAHPLAALDLPLKLLVWSDGGQTKVSYTDPAALASRHGLEPVLAARLAGIEAISDAVSTEEGPTGEESR